MDFDELELEERMVRRKEVEDWLDKIIEAYNALGKEFSPNGEEYYQCPRCICVHPSDKEIQLGNIGKLTEYASIPVTWSAKKVNGKKFFIESFIYKGYKFFEWQEVIK